MRENRESSGSKNGFRAALDRYGLRILSFVTAVSMLFSVPLLTQSRYVSYMNGYTAMGADVFYFRSTLLGDAADKTLNNSFPIGGWRGFDYHLTFNIMNYENNLLYRDKKFTDENLMNLPYTFEYELSELDENGNPVATDYQVLYSVKSKDLNKQTVSDDENTGGDITITDTDALGWKHLADDTSESNVVYNLEGEKGIHQYDLTVKAPDSEHLAGKKHTVVLKMKAYTDEKSSNNYYKCLEAELRLIRLSSDEVLVTMGKLDGIKYTYMMWMNEITDPDTGEQVASLEMDLNWDGRVLEAYEYNPVFYAYIENRNGQYTGMYISPDKSPTKTGKITLNMKQNMYVELEFLHGGKTQEECRSAITYSFRDPRYNTHVQEIEGTE